MVCAPVTIPPVVLSPLFSPLMVSATSPMLDFMESTAMFPALHTAQKVITATTDLKISSKFLNVSSILSIIFSLFIIESDFFGCMVMEPSSFDMVALARSFAYLT